MNYTNGRFINKDKGVNKSMDDKTRRRKDFRKGLFIIVIAAITACVVKLIWNWEETLNILGMCIGVVSPFLIGLFIAYLINPLVNMINTKLFRGLFRMKKKGITKALSVLLSYALVISLITTCLFYIIPQIIESLMQLRYFIESAHTGYNEIVGMISDLNDKYPQWNLKAIIKFIDEIPELISQSLGSIIVTVLPTLYSTSMSLISAVLNCIIAIIVSVYMLFDKPKLINNCKRIVYAILPEPKADKFLVVSAQCNKIFGNFIIGKMIDSIIIGLLCWIIMMIIGIPYALVISVIVGITNMIPYFGPFIGAVPGILLLLIVDFYYALIFAVIIVVLQQFDGLYLGPKILGESTGLRPIWIIFAITAGGAFAGVLGMFLGVPVVAVLAYLLNEVTEKKLKKNNIVFEADPETDIISRDTLITEDKNLED